MIPIKRKYNSKHDRIPSMGHEFNANLTKFFIQPHTMLLDIGCWSGQLFKALREKEFSYSGIDIEKTSIQHARKINPGAKFYVGSALKLPFKRNQFNIVTLFDVIEHLPENTEEICIKEIRRVIKKGGMLIMSTPADNFVSKILDPAYFLMGHRHYRQYQLTRLLEKNGLKTIKVRQIGGLYYTSFYLSQMFFKHILHSSISKKQPFKYLEKKAKKDLQNKGILSYYITAEAK